MKQIPLILCICMFLFTTVGFYKTDEKTEILYGVCSIGSVICGILQLAIIF